MNRKSEKRATGDWRIKIREPQDNRKSERALGDRGIKRRAPQVLGESEKRYSRERQSSASVGTLPVVINLYTPHSGVLLKSPQKMSEARQSGF